MLILLSLFLIVSAASADDTVSDDSGPAIDVNGDESLDTSDSLDDDGSSDTAINESDDATDTNDSGSNPIVSNSSNNGSAVQFNSTPYKFSSTKNIASTYGKKVKFSVKVLNKDGKAITHTLVTFKANGKTYKVYTNASGISSITLNYNSGKYTISYSAGGVSGKNTYTVKNYYKITLYKWKSGAMCLKTKG